MGYKPFGTRPIVYQLPGLRQWLNQTTERNVYFFEA